MIFLEVLSDTYSKYEMSNFENFNVFHKKLEVKAIQYFKIYKPSCKYIPVLDDGIKGVFDEKY